MTREDHVADLNNLPQMMGRETTCGGGLGTWLQYLVAAMTVVRDGVRWESNLGPELLKWVRRRRRRKRNLAELRALDGGRLADIGLNESTRARIVG